MRLVDLLLQDRLTLNVRSQDFFRCGNIRPIAIVKDNDHNERQNRWRPNYFEDLGVLQAIWAGQAIPYVPPRR